MLLVDSEGPVSNECSPGGDARRWKPWAHLHWEAIGGDADCHLMVQAMEAWLLTDVDAVQAYYGKGCRPGKVPDDIESIAKDRLEGILKDSARETPKHGYDKGRDSFVLLGSIDPEKVKARSPWAKRFLDLLLEKTQGGHPA